MKQNNNQLSNIQNILRHNYMYIYVYLVTRYYTIACKPQHLLCSEIIITLHSLPVHVQNIFRIIKLDFNVIILH